MLEFTLFLVIKLQMVTHCDPQLGKFILAWFNRHSHSLKLERDENALSEHHSIYANGVSLNSTLVI